MLYQSAILLRCARQETRHVDKTYNWNVEAITETYKAGCFARRIRIQHARQYHWLICDDANCSPLYPPETHDDVFGMGVLDFEKIAAINSFRDQLFHIIGLVRVGRNKCIK